MYTKKLSLTLLLCTCLVIHHDLWITYKYEITLGT